MLTKLAIKFPFSFLILLETRGRLKTFRVKSMTMEIDGKKKNSRIKGWRGNE